MSRLWILVCAAAMTVACNKTPSAPPPPSTTPTPGETIAGSERLGWDQGASDSLELATFRYAIYVDGTRSELIGATCAMTSTSGSFACSARLPTLSAGAHSLELASFIVDGGTTFESARSSALRVTVGITAPGEAQASAFQSGVITVSGERLTIELVVEGIDRPNDLAFAPDGRLFVAEEAGQIRVLSAPTSSSPTSSSPTSAVAGFSRPDVGAPMLAIAVDPQFERNHFVYALSAARDRDGDPAFTLARFREAAGTLADRVVLLDEVRASAPHPAGALRFGPDGKLFVAFDDGADPVRAEDLASFNGKVLRLNANGTTPDDQAGASPLYALAYRSPKGLDWDRSTGLLWVVDTTGPRLSAVVAGEGSRKRGVTRTTIALPATTDPSSVAAYRGDLLPAFQHSLVIASNTGQHLLRVRLDPGDPTRVAGMDRLLQNRVGGVRAVAIGPEGAVYFGTDTAIGRLVPTR